VTEHSCEHECPESDCGRLCCECVKGYLTHLTTAEAERDAARAERDEARAAIGRCETCDNHSRDGTVVRLCVPCLRAMQDATGAAQSAVAALRGALTTMMMAHGHHNRCPNVGHPVKECHDCEGGTLHRQAEAALQSAPLPAGGAKEAPDA